MQGILGMGHTSAISLAAAEPYDKGDDPPRDRTAELRNLGFPGRRLGPVQMTTDTALGVTKLVVDDKSKPK